jgi:mRNA interferase RelE/StbE
LSYEVAIKKGAGKALDEIPKNERDRILESIIELKINPRPPGSKKLSGREGWRIRSQNYRIIYEIDDAKRQVLVVVIGHRRDVYRK